MRDRREGGREKRREGGKKVDIKLDSFIHSVSIFKMLHTRNEMKTKHLGPSLLVGLKP